MPRIVSVLIFLISLPLSAQLMLPAEAVPEMADEVYELIRDRHPSSATAEGQARLMRARTQVLEEVVKAVEGKDSIPYYRFTELVAPLQQATECGHLILHPYRDSTTDHHLRENVFPLTMMPLDSGARFALYAPLPTASGDTLPVGTLVTAIDGIPTGTLLSRLMPFSGVNDRGNDYALLVRAARGFSLLYQRYYGQLSEIEIATGEPVGEYVIHPEHKPYQNPKIKVGNLSDAMTFRRSEDGQTGILDIRTFSAIKFKEGNFYKWLDARMAELNADKVPNLVIDLRGNTGGSSSRIINLFSYLSESRFRFADGLMMTGPAWAEAGESGRDAQRRAKGAVTKRERRLQRKLTKKYKPQKSDKRYAGKVVVLIDELTFSASGMFARYVQGSGRGILIGTTSGAAADVTFGGNSGKYKPKNPVGPNNEFNMSINNIQLLLPYATPGNVTPDIVVPLTLEDLLAGRDAALDAALDYLNQ